MDPGLPAAWCSGFALAAYANAGDGPKPSISFTDQRIGHKTVPVDGRNGRTGDPTKGSVALLMWRPAHLEGRGRAIHVPQELRGRIRALAGRAVPGEQSRCLRDRKSGRKGRQSWRRNRGIAPVSSARDTAHQHTARQPVCADQVSEPWPAGPTCPSRVVD